MEMRRGVIGLVLCMSTGMAFGEAQGINPVLNETLTFRLGANFLTVDGDLGSGTDNQEFPDIDIDTLGVDEDETSLYFAARWRPSHRWMIKFDYFGFDNSGDVSRPLLDFGGSGIGTLRAETRLKTDFYVIQAASTSWGPFLGLQLRSLAARYLKNERADLGLGLGLHVIDFDTSLRLTGQLGNTVRKIGTERTDLLVPLPNLLAYGTYAFTPKLSLDGSVAYFSLDYDDYDGSLFRGTINLEYRFTDHIGAGIGYNYTNMNLDIEDDDVTTEYDLNYTGPVVFLSAGF